MNSGGNHCRSSSGHASNGAGTHVASRGLYALCIICFVLASGCAVNPNTGRKQLIALSAAQVAHADMGFAIASAAGSLAFPPCSRIQRITSPGHAAASPCPTQDELAKFTLQVNRMGAILTTSIRDSTPELLDRVGTFHIGVVSDTTTGTASTAGGRIAIGSSLAALDPTDDVVSFLIAREMGHVIARHGEEDAGAQMAISSLTAMVPGGGLVIKLVASMLGSRMLRSTWAAAQQREADELALVLLGHCDRSPGIIAFNLRAGLKRDRLPKGEWSAYFLQSIDRVNRIALSSPAGSQLAAAR